MARLTGRQLHSLGPCSTSGTAASCLGVWQSQAHSHLLHLARPVALCCLQAPPASLTHTLCPACRWVFHPADVFARPRLQRFLALAHRLAPRVKGVFHVSPKAWASASGGTTAGGGGAAGTADTAAGDAEEGELEAEGDGLLQEIAYRRDSRLEVILSLVVPSGGSSEEAIGAAAATGDGGGQGQGTEGQQAAAGAAADGRDVAAAAAGGSGSAAATAEPWQLDGARLAAALERGRRGDWSALEAIVLSLLEPQ